MAKPKEDFIHIKGARLHNLKNVDVKIPRNKLVIVTGVSGSGKSSLAIDTLYAEGQRRYVESLSSYARQFLGRLNKPEVDFINGIAPAIAIEQKVNTSNSRSTVGTTTEIYDYLKLLYARIGKTYDPETQKEVKKHSVTDVIDFIKNLENDSKIMLWAPIYPNENRSLEKQLDILSKQGYARIQAENTTYRIEQIEASQYIELEKLCQAKKLFLVVDRIVVKDDESFYHRISDTIQTTFFEGKGTCLVYLMKDKKTINFNNEFSSNGKLFLEPNVHLFSFNNPYGACPNCEGYGSVVDIDERLVIPNTSLSIYEDAILPWKSDSYKKHKNKLIAVAERYKISIHKPWFELSEEVKELIWNGAVGFLGIHDFFKKIEAKNYKIQNRVMLSRYRGKTSCKNCNGKRLRPEAFNVKINNFNIGELIDKPINELFELFNNFSFESHEKEIAKRLITEIHNRLKFLNDLGLGYLSLNRAANTLSGGESQRINLATSLGSSLVGSMYILDEPSIGLHSKDTEKLIGILKELRDLGNTVIVVEHDEDIMKAADYIIDMGPHAGTFGGELVAKGNYNEIINQNSLTSQYLNHKLKIELPKNIRPQKKFVKLNGARANNLKNIDIQFPLENFTVVTGVSGSGKSTLINKILYPALQKHLLQHGNRPEAHDALEGDLNAFHQIEYVNQNPIGRSSRSNPVTYIKAYDEIRNLFAQQKAAHIQNFQAKHFSFNVEAGRCETCKGEGEVTIEMQFMADVHLTCEMCKGKRFQKEVLQVRFHKKSIFDVLMMTIDEAISFFETHQQNKLVKKLKPLQDVGLGYVTLGQSSSTLSGGEAQRIKLASFLSKGVQKEKTLFMFDEPTTGLHFHDIQKLLKAFNELIDKGHTVLVIEHHLDLIKCADYIIDLGPEGGKNGGHLLYQGTVKELLKVKNSFTAQYLKEKII